MHILCQSESNQSDPVPTLSIAVRHQSELHCRFHGSADSLDPDFVLGRVEQALKSPRLAL
ncbi:MAG TPA: hypothetical protein DCG12_22415 [Planctomycetaceae bacterium]|nr:hypothetical protein [Planctomycetaceae bacterium]